jgi:hypothetical protein
MDSYLSKDFWTAIEAVAVWESIFSPSLEIPALKFTFAAIGTGVLIALYEARVTGANVVNGYARGGNAGGVAAL